MGLHLSTAQYVYGALNNPQSPQFLSRVVKNQQIFERLENRRFSQFQSEFRRRLGVHQEPTVPECIQELKILGVLKSSVITGQRILTATEILNNLGGK